MKLLVIIMFIFATNALSQTMMKLHHKHGIDSYEVGLVDSVVFVDGKSKASFDFKGKKILFCGDSVTKGYVDGHEITSEGYPKLFSEAVGATYVNSGVGGTTLSHSEYGTIKDQIAKGANKSYDFLFVAGGVNDWQLGVELGDFKSAVEDICDYISNNYPQSTRVIFITPINHGGRKVDNDIDLHEYRGVIRSVVECKDKGNFYIVDGETLGFPGEGASEDEKDVFFGDRLHPSRYGYMMYAINLIKVLL